MATDKIQFVDLQTQYQNLKAGIDAAIAKICALGDFILGDIAAFNFYPGKNSSAYSDSGFFISTCSLGAVFRGC